VYDLRFVRPLDLDGTNAGRSHMRLAYSQASIIVNRSGDVPRTDKMAN
jgi:hypothetical protein